MLDGEDRVGAEADTLSKMARSPPVAPASYHVRPGLRWTVLQVLDGWTHPGRPGKMHKKPVVEKRYRLPVFGAQTAGPARGVRDDRDGLRQPGPVVDPTRGPRPAR